MVTDDLHVLPLSLASTLQVVSGAKTQRKDLVEKELALTKPQVVILFQYMHIRPQIIKLSRIIKPQVR